MIRRIRISRYKSFKQAEVGFEPFTCLFGPNASGKSNLVDLIAFLSRTARSPSLLEAFRDHRGRAVEAFHWPQGFSEKGMRRLQREQTELSFEVEVDLELTRDMVDRANEELREREKLEGKSSYTRVAERHLRYRLAVGLSLKGGEPRLLDESLVAINRAGEVKKNRPPFISLKEGAYFIVHLEKQNHPRYFPLARMSTLLSEISDLVNHPHLVAAKREIASWRIYRVETTSVGRETGLLGTTDPGRHGEDIAPFYFQLKSANPVLFDSLVSSLRQMVPSVAGVDVREVSPGVLDLYAIEHGGGEFPLRLLSDGTVRLLCLLAVSASPDRPSLVLYEDPETSIHPRRLREVLDLLRRLPREAGVQVLVTTHSASLLDLVREEDYTVLCTRKAGQPSTFSLFPPGSLLRRIYLEQALAGDEAFEAPTPPAAAPGASPSMEGEPASAPPTDPADPSDPTDPL